MPHNVVAAQPPAILMTRVWLLEHDWLHSVYTSNSNQSMPLVSVVGQMVKRTWSVMGWSFEVVMAVPPGASDGPHRRVADDFPDVATRCWWGLPAVLPAAGAHLPDRARRNATVEAWPEPSGLPASLGRHHVCRRRGDSGWRGGHVWPARSRFGVCRSGCVEASVGHSAAYVTATTTEQHPHTGRTVRRGRAATAGG